MQLTQTLRRAAQIVPRANAVADGPASYVWAEVAERVARFAGALRAAGLQDGDRVAILGFNSHRYFEALFSVPWAGGAVVPINTRLAPPEIDFILADSGACMLLVEEAFWPAVRDLPSLAGMRAIVALDGARSSDGRHPYEDWAQAAACADRGRGGEDLSGIYYTGGTTGRPKGVMLTHGNLVANATNVVICLGYDRDTRYLHAAPMFHLADGCSTFGVTMQGGSHVFRPRFEPLDFLGTIARERVTDVTLVPTMINMFLGVPDFAAHDLSSMKRIYFGAAPMPVGLLRRALAAMPHIRFQQAWGMTELSPIATTMDPRFLTLDAENAGRLRSCGQAVPSVEVRVVDEAGNEVPRGTIGEIVVRGPTVMAGYWNQPEATAAALRDGWMHSGDAGTMDEDGFVTIVDRLKDMIITGGENVYSAEVENAISLMEDVGEVAVIGVPDEVWGECVHAIVVPRAGRTVTPEAVIAHTRALIAGYKCPRSVEIRTEPLPLSAAGKVMKTALRSTQPRGAHAREATESNPGSK